MQTPAIAGPTMLETCQTVAFMAIAFNRWFRGTRFGMRAVLAGVLTAVSTPPRKIVA